MALVQLSSKDRIDIPISQDEFMHLPIMTRAKLMLICLDAYIYQRLDDKGKDKWEGLWSLIMGSLIQVIYTFALIWVVWPYFAAGGSHADKS